MSEPTHPLTPVASRSGAVLAGLSFALLAAATAFLILFAIVVENDIRNVDSRKTPIETDLGITPPFERRKQIDADHNEYASDDQYGA